jgi:hypothetical protein
MPPHQILVGTAIALAERMQQPVLVSAFAQVRRSVGIHAI